MRKIIFICDKCEKEKEWNEQCMALTEAGRTIEFCPECATAYKADKKKLQTEITAIDRECQKLIKEKRLAFENKWVLGKGAPCDTNAKADEDIDSIYRLLQNLCLDVSGRRA